MTHKILAINPGSTSTKIGLFDDDTLIFKKTIEHHELDCQPALDVLDQRGLRKAAIINVLAEEGHSICDLTAVVGRGGILPPIRTGGYIVNQAMKDALTNGSLTPHASNLGALLADEIAQESGGIPAYIYDAVSASEFTALAQITGLPEVSRTSFCHVLNSRAVAHRYARKCEKAYRELNFLVAHLGGGITISVHDQGKIVDSLSDDNGPFSPERAGGIPLLDFVDICFDSKDKSEVKKRVRGAGGLKAHLGTSNVLEIVERMNAGDSYAKLMLDAQAYQIAKGIGLLAPVLKGNCDAILITGGIARSNYIVDQVKEYVSFIAPVEVIPGEFELEALAEGALRILRHEEEVHEM